MVETREKQIEQYMASENGQPFFGNVDIQYQTPDHDPYKAKVLFDDRMVKKDELPTLFRCLAVKLERELGIRY